MEYTRPKSNVLLSPIEKRKLVQEYLKFYEEQSLIDVSRLNGKIPRHVFEESLDQIGGMLLEKSRQLSTENVAIKKFLDETPLPPSLDLLLPTDFRVFCLLLNALKQWLSAEQAATDRYLLGGTARDMLRSIVTHCIITGEEIDGNGELHHPVRDGRPPIYISKMGHAKIEGQIKTTNTGDETNNLNENDTLSIIMDLKKAGHHSWVQLRNACNFSLGNDVKFSTPAVKATSLQFARKVIISTGLGYLGILDWLDQNTNN